MKDFATMREDVLKFMDEQIDVALTWQSEDKSLSDITPVLRKIRGTLSEIKTADEFKKFAKAEQAGDDIMETVLEATRNDGDDRKGDETYARSISECIVEKILFK